MMRMMDPGSGYEPGISSAMEPGVKVRSWAFDEDPSDHQRPVDDFFTIFLNYNDRRGEGGRTTGTLKLKKESDDWHVDIMGWLAELNIDVNAWDCTINVVVESCESLLKDVHESGRKSLEFKVWVFQEEMEDYQEELDYQPMYSDDIDTTECIEEDCEPMFDCDHIKSTLQDSGVRFANAHSGTTNTCSICLEEFGISNNVATLPCSHIYHENCLIRWVFQGKRTCPLCRLEIKV